VSIREDERRGESGDAPRRGRPRDQAVDERILDVARGVYAERGWAGFNFDVVAARARVSKDAMYRRYTSKMDLLMATMTNSGGGHDAIPYDGDIRAYLMALAREYLKRYSAEHGLGSLRIFIEGIENAELLDAYHREQSAPAVLRARAVVRRAMEAGQLPLETSPTAILDAILGGVIMHVLATPPGLREKMIAGSELYLNQLVDLVLRGCGYDFGTG